MTWVKGQSGNPAGRPPKKRLMTRALERSLSRSVLLPDGRKITGKRYVADLVRQAMEKGEVTLANGIIMTLDPDDVIALLRWAFSQIDGPPQSEVDVTSLGEKITFIEVERVSDTESGSGNDQ